MAASHGLFSMLSHPDDVSYSEYNDHRLMAGGRFESRACIQVIDLGAVDGSVRVLVQNPVEDAKAVLQGTIWEDNESVLDKLTFRFKNAMRRSRNAVISNRATRVVNRNGIILWEGQQSTRLSLADAFEAFDQTLLHETLPLMAPTVMINMSDYRKAHSKRYGIWQPIEVITPGGKIKYTGREVMRTFPQLLTERGYIAYSARYVLTGRSLDYARVPEPFGESTAPMVVRVNPNSGVTFGPIVCSNLLAWYRDASVHAGAVLLRFLCLFGGLASEGAVHVRNGIRTFKLSVPKLRAVLAWAAAVYQGKRSNRLLVAHGPPGCGKDMFIKHIMEPLVGTHNVETSGSNTREIAEWTANFAGKLLLNIQDMSAADDRNGITSSLMRMIVTDATISASAKHQMKRRAPNVGNVYASTNMMALEHLQAGERRLLAVDVAHAYMPNTPEAEAFYSGVVECTDPASINRCAGLALVGAMLDRTEALGPDNNLQYWSPQSIEQQLIVGRDNALDGTRELYDFVMSSDYPAFQREMAARIACDIDSSLYEFPLMDLTMAVARYHVRSAAAAGEEPPRRIKRARSAPGAADALRRLIRGRDDDDEARMLADTASFKVGVRDACRELQAKLARVRFCDNQDAVFYPERFAMSSRDHQIRTRLPRNHAIVRRAMKSILLRAEAPSIARGYQDATPPTGEETMGGENYRAPMGSRDRADGAAAAEAADDDSLFVTDDLRVWEDVAAAVRERVPAYAPCGPLDGTKSEIGGMTHLESLLTDSMYLSADLTPWMEKALVRVTQREYLELNFDGQSHNINMPARVAHRVRQAFWLVWRASVIRKDESSRVPRYRGTRPGPACMLGNLPVRFFFFDPLSKEEMQSIGHMSSNGKLVEAFCKTGFATWLERSGRNPFEHNEPELGPMVTDDDAREAKAQLAFALKQLGRYFSFKSVLSDELARCGSALKYPSENVRGDAMIVSHNHFVQDEAIRRDQHFLWELYRRSNTAKRDLDLCDILRDAFSRPPPSAVAAAAVAEAVAPREPVSFGEALGYEPDDDEATLAAEAMEGLYRS